MTPEHWQQIEKLLNAALELNASQRAAFLAAACAGDEALRKKVEAMLAHADQAEKFIEAPALEEEAKRIAAEQAKSQVGRQLGPYQILSLLGAGGMGEVYLAQDSRLGRKVALKLLPEQFTKDADRVRRFEQEARAASALNHPNIITIYDIGQVDDLHYLAAEFVDGQTLRQRLKATQLKLREALEVALQVASALAVAHEAGIVHRDIKPENIMLRRDGYIKVLDFGLAKLTEKKGRAGERESGRAGERESGRAGERESGRAGERESGRAEEPTLTRFPAPPLTNPGIVLGTVNYMSPEQARGQEVDERSDLFSLGIVLYEMVAGKPPFEGATAGEVLAAILNQEPPPLARYSREAPAELERIVAKTLAKDCEERYQVAKDLLIDLKSLKLELEVEAKLRRAGQADAKDNIKPEAQRPVEEPLNATLPAALKPSTGSHGQLEPVGGAVSLDSEFYIVRPTDEAFRAAIARRDSIVLLKGARQMGKTSLLARGLHQARAAGIKVVQTDFQLLNADQLASIETLLRTLAAMMADELELEVFPDEVWNPSLGPSMNFRRFMKREVLGKISAPLVWGLDEVDRLFTCNYGSEVFGLFRSWHNARALDPTGPWRQFSLAIAYATEAHLFITDVNQSPFNVGTRLALEDFNFEQVAELNRRYGSPLQEQSEVARYFRLVGGHPYLVRRGLYELATQGTGLTAFEAQAERDEGPFGDHLRRILVLLAQDQALTVAVRGVLLGQPSLSTESFYRLRSAGVMAGDSAREARPRCQLYATYLKRHLL